jgi:FkbM family methyltransferase
VVGFSSFLRELISTLPGGRRLRAELDHLHRQRVRLHRRITTIQRRATSRQLDPAVLRGVFLVRHAALRESHDPARAEREAAFAVHSECYRQTLAAEAPPQADRVDVDGLHWWIPHAGSTEPERGSFQRRIPFEDIVQARELAVGRTMIDIGANVGMTSIPRVVLGDFDCVYAAEADPLNYECLVRNIVDHGLRGSVMADSVAIGDTDGTMLLQQGTSGTHHLVHGAVPSGREAQPVRCLTLDTWVATMGISTAQIGFIKCDTQGWDARVLAGAKAVLACRHIAWQIEFSPSMLARAGTSANDMFATIRANFTHFIDLRGEDGRRLRPTGDLAAALASVGAGTRGYTNLLLFNATV